MADFNISMAHIYCIYVSKCVFQIIKYLIQQKSRLTVQQGCVHFENTELKILKTHINTHVYTSTPLRTYECCQPLVTTLKVNIICFVIIIC